MAIVVDEQTILYLGYSESSNHYLTGRLLLNALDKHLSYHFIFFYSIISMGIWLKSLTTHHCPLLSLLSVRPRVDFVYIATEAGEVVSIPLENCSSYLTCSECVASMDPLCGWCSVEAKCSRVIDCQNSSTNGRYIENGQTGNCFDTVMVDPAEFITDLIVGGTFEVSILYNVILVTSSLKIR